MVADKSSDEVVPSTALTTKGVLKMKIKTHNGKMVSEVNEFSKEELVSSTTIQPSSYGVNSFNKGVYSCHSRSENENSVNDDLAISSMNGISSITDKGPDESTSACSESFQNIIEPQSFPATTSCVGEASTNQFEEKCYDNKDELKDKKRRQTTMEPDPMVVVEKAGVKMVGRQFTGLSRLDEYQ